MTANAEQIDYWNGPVGERWAAYQDVLDKALAAISDAALAFAHPNSGERVLDIGCGCGTTTYALAKAVGPSGSVTGADISLPMLKVARGRGVGVNFLQADAATHLFHATHDLVFSRFGVMFFDDPIAAFANIRKALVPNGRIAFVCWRAARENHWASVPIAAAMPLLPPQEPVDPLAPGPFAFADDARLRSILVDAGYHNIRLESLNSTMNMGADLDAAADQALRVGPLARAAAELDDATREKIRGVVRAALAGFATPQGVKPPAACWLVAATP
ncbi:MAG: class I SAM-dependent methyltransferase [Alphaproteobacteria bacterium]|nr:class I SAM-dependent methyltransferase [Alphaproteobacteria bacterium]MBV9692862.1 class I SAM-dependent methyltransferase [Alphaproteobacteria bacterium]